MATGMYVRFRLDLGIKINKSKFGIIWIPNPMSIFTTLLFKTVARFKKTIIDVWFFATKLEIFYSYWDVTIDGKELSNLVLYLVFPVFKLRWFYFDIHADLNLHRTFRLVASYDKPGVLTTSLTQIHMEWKYIIYISKSHSTDK